MNSITTHRVAFVACVLLALAQALSSCAVSPRAAKRDHAYYLRKNEGPKAAAAYCASEGLEGWCWSDVQFWATVDRR